MNEAAKKPVTERTERTILIVKPPSYVFRDEIVAEIESTSLGVRGYIDITLSATTVLQLYKEHYGRDYFNWLCDQMLSGPVRVCLVEGRYAISYTRGLAGETKPEEARIKSPHSLRAKFSEPDETMARSREESRAVRNVVHTPDSPESAKREGMLFFPAAFTN